MSAAEMFENPPEPVVADLMSQPLLTVEVGESLWDAWQLLFVSGLRHLVVLNNDGASMGVLSDRNVLADVPATSDHLSRRKVGDVLAMVPLVSCSPDDSPLVAARIMSANAIDAVPVLDDRGRVIGIITCSDIIRWLAR